MSSIQLLRSMIVALMFGVFAIGCSDDKFHKVFPVSGRILVNGQPADDCLIYLHRTFDDDHPRRVMPYAVSNAAGEYKITSYITDDGAPQGEYIVTIEWRERSGVMNNNYEGIDRLDGAYAKPEITKSMPGFKVQVGKQPLVLPDFELKQSPEAKRKHEEWKKRKRPGFSTNG